MRSKFSEILCKNVKYLIDPVKGMSIGELALRIGLTKEQLILLLIQAAIIGVSLALGIGKTEPVDKIPL